MDIIAHGLWTGAGATLVKRKIKSTLSVRLATFFGLFPDLFSFSLLPFWVATNLFQGDVTFSEIPRDLPPLTDIEPSPPDTFWIFRLTSVLYGMSHSAIIFLAAVVVVSLFKRRLVWEMFGWLSHIVIDVFTHSYEFYPTPVLWPLSGWRFNGLAWHTPWFIVINYAALIAIYFLLLKRKGFREAKEKWIAFLTEERDFDDIKLAVRKIARRPGV